MTVRSPPATSMDRSSTDGSALNQSVHSRWPMRTTVASGSPSVGRRPRTGSTPSTEKSEGDTGAMKSRSTWSPARTVVWASWYNARSASVVAFSRYWT